MRLTKLLSSAALLAGLFCYNSSFAEPVLTFTGAAQGQASVSYSNLTLSMLAEVDGVETPQPEPVGFTAFSDALLGSDLTITTQYSHMDQESNYFGPRALITGYFDSVASDYDFKVTDEVTGALLLGGNLTEQASMSGIEGFNSADFNALFELSAGSLLADFESIYGANDGNLISFQYNLSENINDMLFSVPFDGSFSGNVEAVADVPEPATLALLGLGLFGLAACRRQLNA